MKNANNAVKSKKMSKSTNVKNKPTLDDEVTAAIASKIISTTPAPEVAQRIKSKLMQRVANNNQLFMFAKQSTWHEVYPGVKVRLLREENNTKLLMVEMAANSCLLEHSHTQNEESFVIKGEVYIEGILCGEGDYHYAPSGSQHQKITTKTGCTLLVKNY